MEAEAFLADSIASAEGKLYVQGAGWNQLNVQTLPARHDRIGVGVIVTVPYTATNQPHKFTLHLEDEDGNTLPLGDAPPGAETADGKIREFGGQFSVGRPPSMPPGDEQAVAIAINIDGLQFAAAGRYRFIIELDGSRAKELAFRVTQPVPEAGPILR